MNTRSNFHRAVVVHGYSATPDDHWFGWLASTLDSRGTVTAVPALPDPHDPDATDWARAVGDALGDLDRGTVVVAHSLGCLAVLRHLIGLQGQWSLGALVLVSGFVETLPALPQLDGFIAGDGRLDNGSLNGLAHHTGRLAIVRSDDDTYVPSGHTDRLASVLGTDARVLPGRGHFLAGDGVDVLPEILDYL